VLVVDDDEAFRAILRPLLAGLADRVEEAGSGREALTLLEGPVPDVVFLDLRMPDLDGRTLLGHMGEEPRWREVPVVIVTSVDLGVEGRAGLSRAHALLPKSELTRARLEAVLAGLAPGARS
jgi:CheY-like chemotaxis protein